MQFVAETTRAHGIACLYRSLARFFTTRSLAHFAWFILVQWGKSRSRFKSSENTCFACSFVLHPFTFFDPGANALQNVLMFPFTSRNKMSDVPETPTPEHTAVAVHPLDDATGGAFSAATSGERASRVREWLASEPTVELLQEVFKDLSARDKGAARPVRERLDELRRAKAQESIGAEWATKAQALLMASRFHIADAMAWQRDAAKAGAPLSREPLAQLKSQLADRGKVIEDLQHRVQVQREAAVLLAQRIEVLSTKPWRDASAATVALGADVEHWQAQAQSLNEDASWPSVEARFPPLLEASGTQLLVVWQAFQAAVAQAVTASENEASPLPAVPMWAEELHIARGGDSKARPQAEVLASKPRVEPGKVAEASARVTERVARLEEETSQGHGKGSAGAANALRTALKQDGRFISPELEQRVNSALLAAGELEGWQRWSADQVREDLLAKARALLNRPDGQSLGGRKMQESLRMLREQWKQADQGGAPNHALWKQFDQACTEAHKVVEAWLEKIRADAAEHKAERLGLIEEVKTWSEQNAANTDWREVLRALHGFGDRWRNGGHVGEKLFAELQPQWKLAIDAAAAPFETAQRDSLSRRQAMIDEAVALGTADFLRIDAVKDVQQRWQAEAQSVPVERRREQKLWDAFRKPIDDAFNRKTAERERGTAQASEHDKAVLLAARALDAANASGDAQVIRAAVAGLEAALRGQAADVAARQSQNNPAPIPEAKGDTDTSDSGADVPEPTGTSTATAAATAQPDSENGAVAGSTEGSAPELVPASAPKPAPKRVVAVRGDDRPGMRKEVPAAPGRGRPGERRDDRSGGRPGGRDGMRDGPRFGDRPSFEERGPRLGDAAFRAQRDALEHAQAALRKLAAQAHGEALTHLLSAWEQRDASLVPSAQEMGRAVSGVVRNTWVQALTSDAAPAGKTSPSDLLLRLEMAADVPTPAEQISARRLMQLQLLTRRNEASPAETWQQDVAQLLGTLSDAQSARRLQNLLKVLMRG